jgi:glucokinase
MSKSIIVWDLGATKCAAALMLCDDQNHYIQKSAYIKLKDCNTLEELILTIEKNIGTQHNEVDAICIGAAGVYNGESLELDNGYPYLMNFGALSKKYHWAPFHIIHDYAPIVCATFTPHLTAKKLNDAEIDIFGRRVALGVGTGLGLKDGVLLDNSTFWLGSNEMGHIGLSHPVDASPELLEFHHKLLQQSHISFEKILSGSGLLKLNRFLHPDDLTANPEEIRSEDTLKIFAFYLGLFIGTVQLTFMPSGGIFIAGGVVQKNPHLFDYAEFWKGVKALPAYLNKRETFPLRLLYDDNHAFFGGAYYAVRRICRP